jgi:hypothetical protein
MDEAAAGARAAIAVAEAAVDVRVEEAGAGFGPVEAADLAFARVRAAVRAVPETEIEAPRGRPRRPAKGGW